MSSIHFFVERAANHRCFALRDFLLESEASADAKINGQRFQPLVAAFRANCLLCHACIFAPEDEAEA